MKKILVPIDFSDTSLSAFFFAKQIATKFDSTIDVVHIYDGSINTNKGLTFELMQSTEQTILNRLKKFVNIPPQEGGVQIATNINHKAFLAYNTSSKLSKLSEEYDLVVMGMTGTHAIEKKWLGSIASYVAQHASCPVLLIPRTYNYEGIRNIVYARNWESVHDFALASTVDLGKKFYAAIHFVHVNETLDIMDFSVTEQSAIMELLAENAPEIVYHIANVDNDSVKNGIEIYAKEHDADIIVLVNHQHRWIDNLFRRSITKEMALNSSIPLLIYQS